MPSPLFCEERTGVMKVSVVVITYNHADYIDQALRSVYEQDVDFEFEVIISEDASTDGTREIIQDWRDHYPERTRLLLSDRNIKSNRVVSRGFAAARGDYVALLDGDDYWTSPLKLRRQTSWMDADPSLSLSFHNAEVVGGEGPSGRLWTSPDLKSRFGLSDLWHGNPFTLCGSMFRRARVEAIPSWYEQFLLTDWPLYALFAEQGDIGYWPEAMCAYRQHAGGQFSTQSRTEKLAAIDALYRYMNDGFEGRYDAEIRAGHRGYFLEWAKRYLLNGEMALAKTSLDLAKSYGEAENPVDRMETMMLSAKLMLARRARASRQTTA